MTQSKRSAEALTFLAYRRSLRKSSESSLGTTLLAYGYVIATHPPDVAVDSADAWYPSHSPCGRSCEAGVPVQRGRGGDTMSVCKLDHRAHEAGGLLYDGASGGGRPRGHHGSGHCPAPAAPSPAGSAQAPRAERRKPESALIIGSGPVVIGQAAEFDYAGTQACRALRAEGVRTILVNSNPATIMTDAEVADAVYLEPLTVEAIEQVIAKERPEGLLADSVARPRSTWPWLWPRQACWRSTTCG